MNLYRFFIVSVMIFLGAGSSCADVPTAPKDAGIVGMRTIGITVSDIDGTLAFYRQIYTLNDVKRWTVDAATFGDTLAPDQRGPVEVALVETPNVYLRLFDFDPDSKTEPLENPVYGPGYTHICFISPDPDDAYSAFTKAGLDMISRGDGPVDIGGYGILYAYGRDPDGTMVELEMHEKPRRDGPYWIGHVGNVTPDIDRMVSFYEMLLGYNVRTRLEQDNHPRLGDVAGLDNIKVKGAWFALRNIEYEIWHYARPLTPAHASPPIMSDLGYNLISFEVKDLASTEAFLKAHDIPIVHRINSLGGWSTLIARDPDGTLIGFEEAGSEAAHTIGPKIWIDPATF